MAENINPFAVRWDTEHEDDDFIVICHPLRSSAIAKSSPQRQIEYKPHPSAEYLIFGRDNDGETPKTA